MGNKSSRKLTINPPIDDKKTSRKKSSEEDQPPAASSKKEEESPTRSEEAPKEDVKTTDNKESVEVEENLKNEKAATPEDDKQEEEQSIEYDGHPIKLFYMWMSPPCRSVMITARILGINLELIECDVLKGENKTPEFTKINPQQTIPTIDDESFYLWESRPIMTYLTNKYGKDDSLYPKNEIERAYVDQKLFFDISTLYCRLSDCYYPALFHDKDINPDHMTRLKEAVDFLNTALKDRTFSAGNHLTLADITLAVTVSNLQAFSFDFTEYPNILPWLERTEEALKPYGYDEINLSAVQWFKDLYNEKMKNKKYEPEAEAVQTLEENEEAEAIKSLEEELRQVEEEMNKDNGTYTADKSKVHEDDDEDEDEEECY